MNQPSLQQFIADRLKTQKILLCSHAVLGYPTLAANGPAVAAFAAAGVDIMELQFPFSDPMADGPILVEANQEAIRGGIKIQDCFDEASRITKAHPGTAFLIMTYYNIVYARGLERFAEDAALSGIRGIIIPDLPLEEAKDWVAACARHKLAPIFMVTPHTPDERVTAISQVAGGFLYCVARKGITGVKTQFDAAFFAYIARVKGLTSLPIGVGFGVQNAADIARLVQSGDVQVAIVCSKAIQLLRDEGVAAAAAFLKCLR